VLLSPENMKYPRGPTACWFRKATPAHRNVLVLRASPGSLEQGHAHKDSPGTWEASTSPRKGTARGPDEIRAGRDASLLVCIAKRRPVVPPNEGIRSAAGRMPRNRSEP